VSTTRLDPFTGEVIKDALIAVGDEMFIALQRTSMSTIIYEVLDFASGLTDARGQLITQGNGVTGFLGTLTVAVRSTLDKFGDGPAPR
jgi:N-methylhydantoinase B